MTPNQVRTRQTATCRVAALVDSPAGAGCRELRTGPGRVRGVLEWVPTSVLLESMRMIRDFKSAFKPREGPSP